MAESVIEQSVVQAYLRAQYIVHGAPPCVLKVGQASACLAQIYQKYAVNCAAFITAFNPLGQQLSFSKNAELQRQLINQLKQSQSTFLPAEGADPNRVWPAEESVLIPGLELAQAKETGRKFRQNAIVWCGP